MFEPETTAFLESGCALIIGTVSPSGEPHAARGWGLSVLPGDGRHVRLLLDAADEVNVENLRRGGAIAITAANVPTLRATQLKGRAGPTEAATDADNDRAAQFCDDFFGDITRTDGTARDLLERLRPAQLVACVVAVDEVYDQTPGPGAGAAMAAGSR